MDENGLRFNSLKIEKYSQDVNSFDEIIDKYIGKKYQQNLFINLKKI